MKRIHDLVGKPQISYDFERGRVRFDIASDKELRMVLYYLIPLEPLNSEDYFAVRPAMRPAMRREICFPICRALQG